MPVYTQVEKIILAIEATRSTRAAGDKLSVLRTTKTYSVPESSLRDRMNHRPRRERTQPERRFPLRLAGVEDMANLLLRARNGEPFALLHNLMAKYGIGEGDIYNFDETSFIIGVITALIVVTRADRRGKANSVQPGNREWATVIECINSGGWCIPPFVIVQGAYHLASWTTESGFPGDWVIKPTTNGWTDNETGLDWIKHFNKHTKGHTKGIYRMLIIDGHESHLSAEFNDYCKQNAIITVSMPPHSSHLLQPLDIALYSPLKRAYGDEINLLIRASVNHITKSEFFLGFHRAHDKVFTKENIK
ncbi:transposase [Colletotrichum sojae]|uniref:Transposase n=1 Tax=Colletotrichum sojae TaxID=2175907 RepID=A0A8H6ILX4_9PEZI|nr:transposase [Colletotrichum sojae]